MKFVPILVTGITLLPLCALSNSENAKAAVVYSDNFDGDALGLNASLNGFNIDSGHIDVIGDGFFAYYPVSYGHYVDLDGSVTSGTENPASIISTTKIFSPGVYTLKFDLAGNAVGQPAKTTEVVFGDLDKSITLDSGDGFSTYTYTVDLAVSSVLEFKELGFNDDNGNVLDNIVVSNTLPAVPLPASAPMFGAALMALGAVGYGMKRKAKAGA